MPAYLGGASFMAYRMLQEAIAAGHVENAILQVDFPDFLTNPSGQEDRPPFSEGERRLLVTRSWRGQIPDRTDEVWRDQSRDNA